MQAMHETEGMEAIPNEKRPPKGPFSVRRFRVALAAVLVAVTVSLLSLWAFTGRGSHPWNCKTISPAVPVEAPIGPCP
jgi:hypothetical protein